MKNAMVEITQWMDKWRQNEHSWRMNYATGKQCWRNLPEESRETKVFCWSTVDLQLISDVQQNESEIYIYFLGSLYYTALQDSAIYIRYLYISIYLYIYPYIYLSFQVLSITGFYKIVNIAPSVILGPCCSSILYTVVHTRWLGFPGDLVVEKPPANAWHTCIVCSVPGWGRSPGVGNGNPLHYACLENPKDTGDWGATVLEVTKSQTQLSSWVHIHIC